MEFFSVESDSQDYLEAQVEVLPTCAQGYGCACWGMYSAEVMVVFARACKSEFISFSRCL